MNGVIEVTFIDYIHYLHQEIMFLDAFISLFVCLFVCLCNKSKSIEQIFLEFFYMGRGLAKGRSDYILGKIQRICWTKKQKS